MPTAKFVEDWEYPPKFDTPRADLDGLSLTELGHLKFEDLARFKQAGRFPAGYSHETLTFYAPRDPGLHAVIIWALMQVTHTIAVNMYGFDDPQAASLIQMYTETDTVAVSLTLDSSQAAGTAEKPLLQRFNNRLIGNSIAIGRSSRGAISHDKLLVVDGLYMISGSTNWSFGGEKLQDNQLTITRDAMAAAEARAIIDLNHDTMLKAMVKKAIKEATAKKPAAKPR